MSITTGSRIGPYEVTSQLGEGGMGVVFRARDTKLLRDVALKVLPDHFADDPDRLSRLHREAQLLASLNHPNIAQVYGLEQLGNSGCIVMELVEGVTLAEKLKDGPLRWDEAGEIAKQIAEALAAAHERGIVHRDLKPANIKLTPSGTVKVLDFGLAKALDRTIEPNLSSLPTKVSGSVVGGIVGTIGYMSPEQARGKEVDARSDVWAFGCVLYEMLTGKLAFEGETSTDMIARIITGQPDLELLPADVPVPMRLLLGATLNKNSQQRLQHIGDARLFLDQSLLPAAPMAAAKREQSKLWVAAFVAGLVVALGIAIVYNRSNVPPSPAVMQFEFGLTDYASGVAVSPNGQQVAYIAQPPDDNRAVWIRPIGSEKAQKLAGTDRAINNVIWSPDNTHIAFVADGKLKKVDITTGAVQTIVENFGQTPGVAWGSAGTILYTSKNVLVRVSENGGTPEPITSLDAGRKETIHALPAFLPDGNHFLYVIVSSSPELFLGSLDGKTKTKVMPLSGRLFRLAYAAGYVLFGGDALTAQRLDPSKFMAEGNPIPIADGIDSFWSVSNTGLLFYRKASMTSANKQLAWFDRAGRQVGQIGAPANYGDVELSPNGDRVAVDMIANNNRDVWMIDIARGVPLRITFDPASEWSPSWSLDGSRLTFASSRNGTNHIYEKSATGVGNEDLVFSSDSNEIPVHRSRDGRYIVFSRLKPQGQTGVDTWVLDTSQKKATPYTESPFDKAQARISPDGKWVVYTTNDSGTYQIVVQTFPDPKGGKWQITAQGGIEPKWSRDGRELYYLALDGKMMAVPVKIDRSFEAGAPMALFETPLTVSRSQSPRDRRYDVAADGRFLIAVPAGGAPIPISAILNWTSGLEKK
jgi:Tol biopolymer transport system component/tRNA A-37 threonylcarbamoyl transferase component Bud32